MTQLARKGGVPPIVQVRHFPGVAVVLTCSGAPRPCFARLLLLPALPVGAPDALMPGRGSAAANMEACLLTHGIRRTYRT